MRFRSLSLVALAALAPLAFPAANPHIIINSDPPNATPVTSLSFAFGANQNGGGDFVYQNLSGVTWESLLFTVTLPSATLPPLPPQPEQVTTGPGPFITSTVSETYLGNGNYLFNILFGPAPTGGIPNGTVFSIDLDNNGSDPNGSGDWGAGNDFIATANTTSPEPGTFALAIGGLLALGGLYRRQRRATV